MSVMGEGQRHQAVFLTSVLIILLCLYVCMCARVCVVGGPVLVLSVRDRVG